MHILECPQALSEKGFAHWPAIMVVGQKETPPLGMPYLRQARGESDYAIVMKLLIPTLRRWLPRFKWEQLYFDLTGRKYQPLTDIQIAEPAAGDGTAYSGSVKTINLNAYPDYLEMASDFHRIVDMETLSRLRMMPTFMEDIKTAVRENVTNEYFWTDGWDKKRRIASGYLTPAAKTRTLLIVDISYSIPNGVVAGLMTLLKTMTEVTHADLILTSGKSFFYPNDEVRSLDIDEVRANMPRGNESKCFCKILRKLLPVYRTVIAFGDSDHPNIDSDTEEAIRMLSSNVRDVYSMFLGKRDEYGISYQSGAGYARWAMHRGAVIHHDTDWVRYYGKSF